MARNYDNRGRWSAPQRRGRAARNDVDLFFHDLMGDSGVSGFREGEGELAPMDTLEDMLETAPTRQVRAPVEQFPSGAWQARAPYEQSSPGSSGSSGSSSAPSVPGPSVGTTFFRMRVDADRDGTVDATDPPTTWTWGASGRGAVIMANFDNDPAGTDVDSADRTIDAGNDAASDIAPLVIEPVPSTTVPAGTRLELSASPSGVIRIFGGATAGSTEIIGPTTGATHRFPTLPTGRLQLGMEAVRYAGTGFDGTFEIKLRTIPASGTAIVQRTIVRVAPWMMPNHTHAAEKVFVVDAGSFNSRFRTDLRRLVTAAGCTLQEHASNDIWMQDAFEFGVSNLPGRGFRTVFRAPRNRPLQTFPRTLLAPELGYTTQGTLTPDTTFDSHGNLEASPAVTVNRKHYRFGRIYYGPGRPYERMDSEVRDFLRAQIVQEPFEIDTNWLVVGHVDEVVSFVPTHATSGNRFKLLIASPRRAYTLLDGIARTNPTTRMFVGKSLDGTSIETTVRAFLTANDDIHPVLRSNIAAGLVTHTPRPLRTYNNDRQANIDAIKTTMTRELGLAASDIIEVPSIFMPNPDTPTLADALVPGMVNMLVVNRHCIVPKPFGPIVSSADAFEGDLRTSLTPLGLTVNFLDCWTEYHVNLGEVHCGTNTLRTPNRGRFWLFQP